MRVADDLIPHLTATPQPVALALGRVVRVSGATERLEACLKAAEVVARYLAVAGLASAAAVPDPEGSLLNVPEFVGNLSFGSFDKAARAASKAKWDHPLREKLRRCFRGRRPLAGIPLEPLVQLRNQLGHALTPADEQRARAILADQDPIGTLIEIVSGAAPILSLPLVVALQQQHRRGRFQARLAFYVGEGEPIPREIALSCGIYEWETPYLCTEAGLIPLAPGLLLHPQTDGRFGLYLIDGIGESEVHYKSVYDNTSVTTRTAAELARWIELPFQLATGSHPPTSFIEQVNVEDGRTLLAFMRGDPVPSPAVERPQEGTEMTKAESEPEAVFGQSTFEHQANAAGLGSAYRDILYFLLERGHRAEPSQAGIRVVTPSDLNRVLLSISLQPGPELLVTILPGAFRQKSDEKEIVRALKPNQSADEVLKVLKSLT